MLFRSNGSISRDELRDALLIIQPDLSENELTDMINAIDENRDGDISFEEFEVLMKNQKIPNPEDLTEKEVDMIFTMLDSDKNGLISASELKVLMKQIDRSVTDRDIDVMIKMANDDDNNLLSQLEFRKMMLRPSDSYYKGNN